MYFKAIKSTVLSRFGVKTPLEIFHKVTFRCNLKCKYCGLWKEKRDELNTKQVKKAIKEFADAGCIFWNFSGGEPLLREDIGKLVDYAKNKGIDYVQLMTNGILFEQEMKKIKQVDNVYISLDGPKKIHEKIKGRGSFDKVFESIKLAKENDFKITILSVLSKYNLANNFHGLKWLFELAKKLDVQINFQPIFYDRYCRNTIKTLLATKEEYVKALELIKNFKENTNLVRNSLSLHDEWIKNYKNENSNLSCFAGKLYAVLFPDGLVAPCFLKESEGLNGSKIGFLKAFNQLNSYPNCHCMSCFAESNLLFSLKFEAMKNSFFNKLNALS